MSNGISEYSAKPSPQKKLDRKATVMKDVINRVDTQTNQSIERKNSFGAEFGR